MKLIDAEPQVSSSATLHERARQVMPGGNTRVTVHHDPYPLYARLGRGARITDVDGRTRLDFLNNYTTLIHGHAHPDIVAAVTEAAHRGTCFGLPTEYEISLAEAICARNPSFQRVRFMNSGTEAVMLAVQAARAWTQRHKIAKVAGAYHGGYDAVAIGQDLETIGQQPDAARSELSWIPDGVRQDTIVIPFNDVDAALRLLEPVRRDLAAILVDPLPYRIGSMPADAGYLEALNRFAQDTGAVLISDEVSSFRLGFAGAIAQHAITPGLTVLGKIIGGGLPIGAVAGPSDIMSVFDPTDGAASVPHAGAFNANPLSMAAGIASLRLLPSEEIDRINGLGDLARQGLNATLDNVDGGWKVAGAGSLFRLRAATPELARRLYTELLAENILIGPSGLGCVSTPMTPQDVSELIEAVAAVAPRLQSSS